MSTGNEAQFDPQRDELPTVPGSAPAAEDARIPPSIWVLLGATFFVSIGFGLVVPVLPQFANSFHVNATLITIVVSAFAVMRLVTAPVAGPLVDRFGERPMYVAGIVIVALSSAATAFAGEYWQLLLYRGLGGIGSVMFSIASSSIVVSRTPDALRGRVSSLWGGLFLIGGIAGPFFGGLLAQGGLSLPFLVYAGALLVAAVIVAIALPGPAQDAQGKRVRKPAMELRSALQLPAYRASLGFGFASGWANMGMRTAVLPLFVTAVISPDPQVAGYVVAVGAVGNVLSLQWAGRASDRVGRRPFILLGLVVSAFGMLGFAFATTLWFVLAVAFVTGFGAGLSAPVAQAAVADLIGRDRSGGKVLSTYQMSVDFGQIIGPVVAGAIIDLSGFGWSFGVAALVLTLAAGGWFLAPETKR